RSSDLPVRSGRAGDGRVRGSARAPLRASVLDGRCVLTPPFPSSGGLTVVEADSRGPEVLCGRDQRRRCFGVSGFTVDRAAIVWTVGRERHGGGGAGEGAVRHRDPRRRSRAGGGRGGGGGRCRRVGGGVASRAVGGREGGVAVGAVARGARLRAGLPLLRHGRSGAARRDRVPAGGSARDSARGGGRGGGDRFRCGGTHAAGEPPGGSRVAALLPRGGARGARCLRVRRFRGDVGRVDRGGRGWTCGRSRSGRPLCGGTVRSTGGGAGGGRRGRRSVERACRRRCVRGGGAAFGTAGRGPCLDGRRGRGGHAAGQVVLHQHARGGRGAGVARRATGGLGGEVPRRVRGASGGAGPAA